MNKARRLYSEEVRNLVREVRSRDPRVLQHNLRVSRQKLQHNARSQPASRGKRDADGQGDDDGVDGGDAHPSEVGEEEVRRGREREREREQHDLLVDELLRRVLHEEAQAVAEASQARQLRRRRGQGRRPAVEGLGFRGEVDVDVAGEKSGEARNLDVLGERKGLDTVGETRWKRDPDDEARQAEGASEGLEHSEGGGSRSGQAQQDAGVIAADIQATADATALGGGRAGGYGAGRCSRGRLDDRASAASEIGWRRQASASPARRDELSVDHGGKTQASGRAGGAVEAAQRGMTQVAKESGAGGEPRRIGKAKLKRLKKMQRMVTLAPMLILCHTRAHVLQEPSVFNSIRGGVFLHSRKDWVYLNHFPLPSALISSPLLPPPPAVAPLRVSHTAGRRGSPNDVRHPPRKAVANEIGVQRLWSSSHLCSRC